MLASLDVLDYQQGLEAALSRPGIDGRPLLEAPLRKQAMRDVRRAVDALAFRYAILDERPLPEDLDYVRALEGLKEPERVAPVLARRRPLYAKNRRRRLVTTYAILTTLALFAAGIGYVATLESAETLVEVNDRREAGDLIERTFVVTPEFTRLFVEASVLPDRGDNAGTITVSLKGPDQREHLGEPGRPGEVFTPNGGTYLRENVYALTEGEWTLRVIYDGPGTAFVRVNGISLNR